MSTPSGESQVPLGAISPFDEAIFDDDADADTLVDTLRDTSVVAGVAMLGVTDRSDGCVDLVSGTPPVTIR